MLFPIATERGDDDHAYGVVVADHPGCFSADDTFEEALANVREATSSGSRSRSRARSLAMSLPRF